MQLKFHVEAAVATAAMAHVDPAAAFLVDALVNGQIQLLDQCQQAAVGAAGADGDIGGFTALVLARRRAAHKLVQFRAAVAAVDPDGTAPRLPQRVEHVIDQVMQGLDGAGGRRVVDAIACGGH